jgi:hypothetical protein
MSTATIGLKPVNDLLKEQFYVPSYQRGYRWSPKQVTDLLDDIWHFHSSLAPNDRDSFYCLQPIVVLKQNGVCSLVDGQQRLTTINLILSFLRDDLARFKKRNFSLRFETRAETSESFLQQIDPAKRDLNIDYYHICNAYDAIAAWFAKLDQLEWSEFLKRLLWEDGKGANVRVIWYELPEDAQPIEVFTRLNVGKIPLTNSELIRALFLRSENFADGTRPLQQIKIAQEWDMIEKTLQDDSVWYFLHSGGDIPANRIEYIFRIIATGSNLSIAEEEDPFQIFFHFNKVLGANPTTVEDQWLSIKRQFMTLEEWYHDRIIYHLIGFLVYAEDDLGKIHKDNLDASKSQFLGTLKVRIYERLLGDAWQADADLEKVRTAITEHVTGLAYGTSSSVRRIRLTLLLFNIATLLLNEKSNLRFPFDLFKKQDWDIEHVRSVASGKPNRTDSQKLWLDQMESFMTAEGKEVELRSRCAEIRSAAKFDTKGFDHLYLDILRHYGEDSDTEADNLVGNLALLDAETNRSYKNSPFPVKRKIIIERDRRGIFVPLCTKNVFLKCYSKKIDNMLFWGDDDKEAYLQEIISTLTEFFASAQATPS